VPLMRTPRACAGRMVEPSVRAGSGGRSRPVYSPARMCKRPSDLGVDTREEWMKRGLRSSL